jgi:aldehyde:ferredoxin oxidoreductase
VEINLRAADIVQKYGLQLVPLPDRPALARAPPREGVLGPGKAIHSEPALGEVRHARVRREADPRPLAAGGHRRRPRRRLGAGGLQVGTRGGPADRPHAVLVLGHARARLRPARRARVGLRQHPRRPRHQRALLQHHLHQRHAAFAFAKPMRIEAERAGRNHRRETVALREEPPRGPRLRRREHVLGGRRAARPLAPALHALLQAVGALCDLRWPDFYNTNTPDSGAPRRRTTPASTSSGTP